MSKTTQRPVTGNKGVLGYVTVPSYCSKGNYFHITTNYRLEQDAGEDGCKSLGHFKLA